MAEKVDIAKLDIDQEGLQAGMAKTIQLINQLKADQKELRASTNNLVDANEEQTKMYVAQDAQLKNLNTTYNTQKKTLADVQTGVTGLTKEIDKNVKSENAAIANNKELRKIRKQLSVDDKNYQKNLDAINEKIDKNNDFLEGSASKLEQVKIGIGNYTEGILNAIPGMGRFSGAINKAIQSANLFKVALLAIPVFALIAAIATLVKAFQSTQRGMDEINKLLAPITGGIQVLVGIIQDLALNIFDRLGDRATLALNAIKININNIRIAYNLLTGDQEKANELIAENKMLTDESAAAQERLNEKTSAFADIWKEAGDRLKEGAATQREIERLQIAIERGQIDLLVPLEKARLEFEKLREIAADQTLSDQERIKALEEAEKQQRFIAQSEKDLLDLKIQQKELQNSLNDTSREDELELQQLKAQAIQADEAAQKKINSLTAQRTAILKRQAAEAVKEFEEQLKHEEKLLAESLKRREELDNEFETAKLYAKTIKFQEELLLLEEQGASEMALRIAQLNQQEILETEALQRKIERGEASQRELTLLEAAYSKSREEIRLAEEEVKLTAVKDVAGQIASIFGEQTVLGKTAAIAQATINTYQGATKALATLPPPFGAIAAGATIGQGLATVGKIVGVQLPKTKKFAKGGLQEVGGHSHVAGGTRFVGEDGTEFEAEKGELIGVMNRNAAKAFMSFNNKGLDGSFANIFSKPTFTGSFSDKNIVGALEKTNSTIAKKPVSSVSITESGLEQVVTVGQTRIKSNKMRYRA